MTYRLTFLMTLIAMALLLCCFSSCNEDDPVDPETQRINDLTATWKVNSVSNDNNDVTSSYSNFQLSIDGLSYSTVNGGNPWPASGSYEFVDNDLETILRSDGTQIVIEELTSETLVLSFNYSTVNGRIAGVTGNFIFSLTKQ